MKKLFFLFIILLQGTVSFAQNTRGTAELFIEIPDRGNYVVYLDDEFAGSSKGRFRFYEVRNSSPTVVVMKDNAEVFRRRINLPINARFLARYSTRAGWRNISTLNLYDRGQYALDNWDRAIFNDRPGSGQGPTKNFNEVMTPDEFKQLLSMVNRETWADEQLKLIKIALKNSMMTTDQVYELVRVLKLGGDQLELAKYAYPFIADKKNAMKIANVFRFSLDKPTFFDFIAKQNN
ncbi:DUF4476 domain-containing protein [Pedobacter gandavensis]|uniref:DUF4476 domain-containing protein n=1 Tax=Pedobacter gandavensis TaxID=2679963 RepID=A0ABR6EYD1_9SPHI|nr:DUF4476 domain-containing protein [Pedobacter gandavensis]MBB2149971.1 DUF4476 domain-containing protein [Pedobacter gandavensis]